VPAAYSQLSLAAFLDRLASDAPTPGGGSVAALCGALAAALGQMAGGLTVGKPKFAAVEQQVREIVQRLARAGQMLRRLMDEDAAAYGELRAAFKLPNSDPERGERVRQAATLAAEVPLETATLAHRVLRELETLGPLANPNLKSDVEAATHVARAATRAAAANVRINLPLLDQQTAAELERQLAQVLTG
jgi:formiminotetrahydrofolate cyclodeaminase